MSTAVTNQKTIGKKTYEECEDAKLVAHKILHDPINFPVAFKPEDNVKVCYLKVYPHITKHIIGRCIKASHTTKYFSDFDYVIEVSGDLWDKLNDMTKEVLMWHELNHIYVEYNKGGDRILKIRDHDVQDFSEIIKQYGIEWFDDLRTMSSSVYDLEPADHRRIRL